MSHRTLYDELAKRPDVSVYEQSKYGCYVKGLLSKDWYCCFEHHLHARDDVCNKTGFYYNARNEALGYGKMSCKDVRVVEFDKFTPQFATTTSAVAEKEENKRRQTELLPNIALRTCWYQLGLPDSNNIRRFDSLMVRSKSLPIYRYPIYFGSCEMLYTRSSDVKQQAVCDWR